MHAAETNQLFESPAPRVRRAEVEMIRRDIEAEWVEKGLT